jgi:polyisoprenoid-binding protein YceI
MKTILTVAALALTMNAFAASDICTVNYNEKASAINWTAFKTPKKVGVRGSFSKFKIKTKKATTIDELLMGATFEIETDSVNTKDKARDAKIFTFFFKTMTKGTKITGKVTKIEGRNVHVDLTLNGVTKSVVLAAKNDESKNTTTLNGKIDVTEFGMKSNLAALTEACKALHEGVTWPDVVIELEANITRSCK